MFCHGSGGTLQILPAELTEHGSTLALDIETSRRDASA